jgi:hypothetical protein
MGCDSRMVSSEEIAIKKRRQWNSIPYGSAAQVRKLRNAKPRFRFVRSDCAVCDRGMH